MRSISDASEIGAFVRRTSLGNKSCHVSVFDFSMSRCGIRLPTVGFVPNMASLEGLNFYLSRVDAVPEKITNFDPSAPW